MKKSGVPVPTGIAGLDEILRGGFPSHRMYLLKGEPGVGKTTIALQFLLESVRRGETAMYITLSETKSEIDDVARSHGWDLSGIAIFELSAFEQQVAEESQNTIFHPAELQLNKTTRLFLEKIEASNPSCLVIDSLSELKLLSDSALRYRREMLTLKQFFAGKAITVIMLDDHSDSRNDLHVESIAHGVLTIDMVRSDYGAERRRIRINKVRGVNFVAGYHDAAIVPGGLKVFPRLVAADHPAEFPSELVTSELPALDTLLGGGLNRGTSSLFLGPAGCGKSSVALQYAIAAAKRGEKVHLYLFEENRRTMIERAKAIGMPLEEVIGTGKLSLTQINPAELCPGEFVHLIKQHVNEGCRMIVIDSLNGYLYAMPNVEFLNIQLHELLTFLAQQGVVTILTVAQHGIVGSMNAPIDITYLADSVLLMRFFEVDGHVKKAISVIKKRIGSHEETIREFRVDRGGVVVGQPLAGFEGVLTGVPTYRAGADQILRDGNAG